MNEKEKKITAGLILAIVIMIIFNIYGSVTASKKDQYTFDRDVEGSDYVLNTESGDDANSIDVASDNTTADETTQDTATEEASTEEPTTEAVTTQATTEASEEPTTDGSTSGTGTSYDMNSSTGYMFPDSDSRVITKKELKSLSKEQAKYAKNEIYARNHYIFKSGGAMESYFTNKDWYSGEYSDQDDVLYNKCNATERKNILNLKKYE